MAILHCSNRNNKTFGDVRVMSNKNKNKYLGIIKILKGEIRSLKGKQLHLEEENASNTSLGLKVKQLQEQLVLAIQENSSDFGQEELHTIFTTELHNRYFTTALNKGLRKNAMIRYLCMVIDEMQEDRKQILDNAVSPPIMIQEIEDRRVYSPWDLVILTGFILLFTALMKGWVVG